MTVLAFIGIALLFNVNLLGYRAIRLLADIKTNTQAKVEGMVYDQRSEGSE
jgi:hypothetical protein